jgi:bacteriophage HK97-gp10 putative tail-component
MTTFNASYKGIGELLVADFIRAEMVRRAGKVLVRARATAPDYEPLGVGYVDEFELTSGTKVSKKGTRRAVATVRNGSKHALYVEFGGQNTPAHRTLGRALSEAGG